jgi:hypothetical protein
VTDLAANPIGTGPPDGTVTVDVVADVVGAAAPVEAAPLAPDAGAELAPPDAAGPLEDEVGEPAAPPAAPELVAPHAVSATAASRAADASPTRDARNDVFIRSPSPAEASFGYGDVRAGLPVTFDPILDALVGNARALPTRGSGCLPANRGLADQPLRPA